MVDNASKDGAPEMVAERFPWAKLIRSDRNLGFSRANNVGIARSTGKYICLVNSDIEVLDNCFDCLFEYLETNPDVGAVAPKILNSDGSLQFTCRTFPTSWSNLCRALALDRLFPRWSPFSGQFMGNFRHDQIGEVDYLSGCFLMLRSLALDKVEPLDERFFFYAEDKDLCKRLWKSGWKIVYYPHAQSIHHLYGSSRNNMGWCYIQETKSNILYYKKHHSVLFLLQFLSTIVLHHLVRIVGFGISQILNPSDQKKISILSSKKCLKWIFGSKKLRMELHPDS